MLRLLTFFKTFNFFKKNSGTLSECETVWIQIRINILSVLIWVQTVSVCKLRLSADNKSQHALVHEKSEKKRSCVLGEPQTSLLDQKIIWAVSEAIATLFREGGGGGP